MSYHNNHYPEKRSTFDNSRVADPAYDEAAGDRTINAENLQIESTLNELSNELKPGETLVLDIGNNYFHQTDEIYDTLVMRGYEVRKTFRNGRNQIVVSKKA
ncbi:MAG TPA: hypothetical protein VHT96_05460 [Clostridia bacterium]|nr:hypothetical protein [Clostridia bacterium]